MGSSERKKYRHKNYSIGPGETMSLGAVVQENNNEKLRGNNYRGKINEAGGSGHSGN
jgi:hypothetical protein